MLQIQILGEAYEKTIACGFDADGNFVSKYGAGYVPDEGDARLYIEAEGETDVHMWGANPWFGKLYKTVDYGLLHFDQDGALRSEDLENFPFNHNIH